MSKTIKEVFQEYACFGRPGKTSDITSKNFAKMIKEKGLMDKKLNSTEIDMIFTKAKAGPGNKVLTFAQFENALSMVAKSKYGNEAEVEKVKSKILEGSGPSTAGTTGVSKTGGVTKLTDSSHYTGSHKERFGKDGKGKGIEGRKDVHADDGYVQGFKK
ncbi:tubulin polymerization-promoting protein family member 2-like [Anneissia japonica]|uniref:tubulin polymerization-promoting protein family member 2-like n=1 Tax=Anneissia japonica TaxID=1529436 RepID=UPI0014255E22|nr:tubulin polymerization-promoting protein family member 2-like [Anneissia japonica]XP_033107758.1 tubulin polymerization-promoting protein family member 2-like [Anneissia japonica]